MQTFREELQNKQTNKQTNDHHSLGNKDVTPSTGSTIAKKNEYIEYVLLKINTLSLSM